MKIMTQRGYGLIEVLVGLTLGLITLLGVTRAFAIFEDQKRSTVSANDIQVAATTAIATLSRDLRNAGYGYAVPGAQGCSVNASFNDNLFTFTLAPVTITQGSGTAPDSINVISADHSGFSVGARLNGVPVPPSNDFCVDDISAINAYDMLIIYQPASTVAANCELVQATNVQWAGCGSKNKVTNSTTSAWNAKDTRWWNNFSTNGIGFGSNARVFDMGTLINRTYEIVANGIAATLSTDSWDTGNQTGTTVNTVLTPIAADIINIQAEYGKDTNADGAVDTWDTNTPTTTAGWQQILAIRIAVAARSPLYEKTVVTPNGTASTWDNGSIDLTLDPSGATMADWNHYRYTVLYTTVPLRNRIWGEP